MAQVEMSKEQLQELLSTAVRSGVSGAMEHLAKMNPLEQRKFDEEAAKDRRRDMLGVELGRAEEENTRRKQNGCTHSVDRQTGEPVARGTGKWITGGQAYQDGTASLLCLRCQRTWRFRPTPEQYSSIVQTGMYGFAPPSEDQTLCNGCLQPKAQCKCSDEYLKQKLAIPA
jgi:hypothetical protein